MCAIDVLGLPAATAILSADPGLPARLTAADHRVLADAADHGHTEAVRLMLDLGFPPGIRSEPDDGATALHLAASAGSPGTVRLLLDHGADIEAQDTTWNATPLEWAIVGSGMRLGHDPDPDWPVHRACEGRPYGIRGRAVPGGATQYWCPPALTSWRKTRPALPAVATTRPSRITIPREHPGAGRR